MGGIGGRGKIKKASASKPLAKEQPLIKAQISGIMVSSGVSDVAPTLVHSEKTRLKKMMMVMTLIIITRARKQAG